MKLTMHTVRLIVLTVIAICATLPAAGGAHAALRQEFGSSAVEIPTGTGGTDPAVIARHRALAKIGEPRAYSEPADDGVNPVGYIALGLTGAAIVALTAFWVVRAERLRVRGAA